MTSKLVKGLVEDYYQLKITSKTRKRKYVEARAIYYKLLRKNTRSSLHYIANTLGMNHATVIHGLNQLEDWIEYDKQLKTDYTILNRRLENAMELNPELFEDSTTIEGFYEIQYIKLKEESSKQYKTILTKLNFLKARLEKYEPNRVKSEEFDVV